MARLADSPLYRRIWDKAAALLEPLASHHGFTDGNKRTSLICIGIRLERSGYTLSPNTSNDDFEAIVMAAATSQASIAELRDRFRDRNVPLD